MIIEVLNKEELNKLVKNYKNKGYIEEKDKLIYKLLKKVNYTPKLKTDENSMKVIKESIFRKILALIPRIILIPLSIFWLTPVIIFLSYKIMASDKFNKDVITISTDKSNLNVNIGGKARVEKAVNKKELELLTEQYNTAGYKTEVLGIDYTRLSKKKFTWWLFIVLLLTLTIGAWIYLIYYAVKKKEIVIIKIDKNSVKSSIESSSNVNDNNVVMIDKDELKNLIKDNTNNIAEENDLENPVNSDTDSSNDNNTQYCTECGNPIVTGSKFCKKCGTKVE